MRITASGINHRGDSGPPHDSVVMATITALPWSHLQLSYSNGMFMIMLWDI